MDLPLLSKNSTCSICKISEWNSALFLRVHALVMRENYDYGAVAKWLCTEIESHNANCAAAEQQKKFVTRTQVATHFTQHVSIPANTAIARTVSKSLNPKGPTEMPFDPVVARRLQDLANHAAAVEVSDLDDFQRFHQVVNKMVLRFDSLDRLFDDPEVEVSKDLLSQYRSFGDSIGRMFAESIKLRQAEKLMHNALNSTLETFSLTALQGILKSVEKALAELRPHMRDPAKADLIFANLRDSIANSMTVSARNALDHLKTILRVA